MTHTREELARELIKVMKDSTEGQYDDLYVNDRLLSLTIVDGGIDMIKVSAYVERLLLEERKDEVRLMSVKTALLMATDYNKYSKEIDDSVMNRFKCLTDQLVRLKEEK